MVKVIEKGTEKNNSIIHSKVYCVVCGEGIVKVRNQSWKQYNARKYCSQACLAEHRSGKNRMSDNKDDSAISNYIEVMTRNGRLMADFNLGVLKAVEAVKDDVVGADEDAVQKKGAVICMYKGVPVTGEIANKAADWLMNNWKGKPGQRSGEVIKAEMTRDEILAGLKSMESR